MKLAVALLAALCVAHVAAAGPLTPVGRFLEQAGLLGTLEDAGVQSPELFGLDQSVSCGGTAPVTPTCAEAFTASPTTFSLYVVAGTPFTGAITATLTDSAGHSASWTCTYLVYVSGVTPGPTCNAGNNEPLVAGPMTLSGAVSGVTLGYWEAHVDLA